MIIKTSYSFMKPPPSARLIRGHRLAQGLAAAYTMAENGGLQILDLSENANRGTFSSIGAGSKPTWTSSPFGSAISFVHSDSADAGYINIPDNSIINPTEAVTVEVYMKQTVDGNLDLAGIVGKWGSNNGDRAFLLYQTSAAANTFRFEVGDGAGGSGFASFVRSLNTYYHLVGTYDKQNVKIYADGVLKDTSGAITFSMPDSPEDFHIGVLRTNDVARFGLTGIIGWVRIWNRAFNASEIAELYSRPFCMLERRARTALLSGYEVVAPPVGMAGAMTTNTGYWGY